MHTALRSPAVLFGTLTSRHNGLCRCHDSVGLYEMISSNGRKKAQNTNGRRVPSRLLLGNFRLLEKSFPEVVPFGRRSIDSWQSRKRFLGDSALNPEHATRRSVATLLRTPAKPSGSVPERNSGFHSLPPCPTPLKKKPYKRPLTLSIVIQQSASLCELLCGSRTLGYLPVWISPSLSHSRSLSTVLSTCPALTLSTLIMDDDSNQPE